MSIPFTQFLRPNGRPRQVAIAMPDDLENIAWKLIGRGARFEIEVLTTGEIYMECLAKDSLLLANQLCTNGPPVVEAIKELLLATERKMIDNKEYQT